MPRSRFLRVAAGLIALFALVPSPRAATAMVPLQAVTPTDFLLGPQGVGPVHFGAARPKAVADLSRLLGPPTSHGGNTGCGSRYREVEWGELVAEFRLGIFSGYRYLRGGWPLTTPGSPRWPSPSLRGPHLATARGASLGTTLGQLRSAYGELRFAGVDKWQAASGVVFVVDAVKEPEPPSSKVVEIKFGTCGDF